MSVIFPGAGSPDPAREEGEVDLFDYFEDGFGDEGAAVEALFDVGPEASIEGFRIETLNDLVITIANAHGEYLLDRCRLSVPGATYVWKVKGGPGAQREGFFGTGVVG